MNDMHSSKNAYILVVVWAACVVACADDIAETSATESSSTTGTTQSLPTTTEVPTTTATTETTSGVPICEQEYPLPISSFELADPIPEPEAIEPRTACNDEFGILVGTGTNQLNPLTDNFRVFVYRPKVAMRDWPEFPTPYVIFSHGVGQLPATYNDDPNNFMNVPRYLELVESFTSAGFVVFAIETPTWYPQKRAHAMACTALWAFSEWSEAENNRLNCDFVVSGHSQGGEAAYFFAESAIGTLNALDYEDRILRGVLALAPRSNGDSTGTVGGADTLSYLILHGANDEDIKEQPTRAFDLFGSEESSPLNKHDKFLLWAHDVPHNDWGGTSFGVQAKAGAIETFFVPAFLRWQILMNGDPDDRQLFTDLVHYKRSDVATNLPSGLMGDMSSFWNGCCDPEFEDLGETPVIFGDFALGIKNDSGARLQIDTMERASHGCSSTSISPSSSTGMVTVVGFGADQVCVDESNLLIQPVPLLFPPSPIPAEYGHLGTTAMKVQWGDTEPEGSIEWEVDQDLSSYSFLSLRVGPINHLSPRSKVTLSVGLNTGTMMGTQTFSVDLDVYTQNHEGVGAFRVDFMRTVRIPLSVFCALGADISQTNSVVIDFPPDVESRAILLDSIEFMKAADIMESGQCL